MPPTKKKQRKLTQHMEARSDLLIQRVEQQSILDTVRMKLNNASADVVDMVHSQMEPAPQLTFLLTVVLGFMHAEQLADTPHTHVAATTTTRLRNGMLQPQAEEEEVSFLDTPISLKGTRTWARLADHGINLVLGAIAGDVLPDLRSIISKEERSNLVGYSLNVLNQPLPKDLDPPTYRSLVQWSIDRYNFEGRRIHSCWSHGTRLFDRNALVVSGSLNWTTCIGPFLVYKGQPNFAQHLKHAEARMNTAHCTMPTHIKLTFSRCQRQMDGPAS